MSKLTNYQIPTTNYLCVVTYDAIIEQAKKKQFAPVYFLHGDEPWFIDQIADAIEENALPAAERSFNQSIFYGRDSDARTIKDVARQYPMMSERIVILLREAQDMKTLTDLLTYIEKPSPTTVLVISHKHGKLDSRTKFGKAIAQHAVVFESKTLYDNQVPDWIAGYVKNLGFKIAGDNTFVLADLLGTEISHIANELTKLVIGLEKGQEITKELIKGKISDTRSFNIFDLQKAVVSRDVVKLHRILQYFEANPKDAPLVVVISTLYSFFSKLYQFSFLKGQSDAAIVEALKLRSSYFLKDYKGAQISRLQAEKAIHLLSAYDLRSKGVNNGSASQSALLDELCWKLTHL
jgi:DNA polymerase III subunit delta